MVQMGLLCTRNIKIILRRDIKMNENVKQLKDRAEFVGDRYALPDEFVEQFIKLFIKDCTSTIEQFSMMSVPTGVIAGLIKKKYGVE